MKSNSLKLLLLLQAAVAVLFAVAAAGQVPPGGPATSSTAADRGRKIFRGDEALRGTITGLSFQLPAENLRCINCHAGPGDKPVASSAAPPLDSLSLTKARQRRGGPASSFTRESFCKLLRSGVDPAFVIVGREMPRYEVTDDQCAALWSFLTAPGLTTPGHP